jgi:hypothetical protein
MCFVLCQAQTLAVHVCSRQESPRFAPRIAGRLELTDIAEEMPFEMRVLEAALDFVRPAAVSVR